MAEYPILFGVGNPLLDLSLKTDDKILKKFNLNANKAYLTIIDPHTIPVFDDIVLDPQLKKIPGGSSQNAIRAFQWLSSIPKSAGYTGSVGDDSLGNQQRELMLNAGVDVNYYVAKGERTGKCAAIITGTNRCLIADIAAAGAFDAAFLYDANLKATISKAKVVYAEGFFVDVSTEALLILAHRCVAAGNAFGLNLSADWVIGKCFAQFLELLPFVTYLFCNEAESRAFAGKLGWNLEGLRKTLPDGSKGDEDVKEIARRLTLFPKVDPAKPRVVVITQGKDAVILATLPAEQSANAISLGTAAAAASAASSTASAGVGVGADAVVLKSFPVPAIEMVDSNGCGDSFVGGFFASLLLKNSTLDEAVGTGIRMAQVCAKYEGVTFGEKGSIKL